MENDKTVSDLANNLNSDLSTTDKKKYYLQLIHFFFEEGSISTLFISKLNNIDQTVELGNQQLQLKLQLIKLWIFIIKWDYKSCEKIITQIKPNIATSNIFFTCWLV